MYCISISVKVLYKRVLQPGIISLFHSTWMAHLCMALLRPMIKLLRVSRMLGVQNWVPDCELWGVISPNINFQILLCNSSMLLFSFLKNSHMHFRIMLFPFEFCYSLFWFYYPLCIILFSCQFYYSLSNFVMQFSNSIIRLYSPLMHFWILLFSFQILLFTFRILLCQ